MNDPITGPLTKEAFKKAVDAPFGEAKKIIQQYDPLWGLAEGEKTTWEVEVQATRMNGRAYVKAATQEEADKLADALTESDVDWDYDNDIEVVSVTMHKAKR